MKRVLVCPVCGSTDVELDTAGITGKFYCKNCGYVGSFIIEMDENEYEKLKEAGELERFLEKKKANVPEEEKKPEKYPYENP